MVKVSVANRSEEPAVLRAAETERPVQEKDEEWKEVIGRDLPNDLLELEPSRRPRVAGYAKDLLMGNRKEQ